MQHYCGGPVLNLCLIPSVERPFIQTPAKMAQGEKKNCRAWRLQRFVQIDSFINLHLQHIYLNPFLLFLKVFLQYKCEKLWGRKPTQKLKSCCIWQSWRWLYKSIHMLKLRRLYTEKDNFSD